MSCSAQAEELVSVVCVTVSLVSLARLVSVTNGCVSTKTLAFSVLAGVLVDVMDVVHAMWSLFPSSSTTDPWNSASALPTHKNVVIQLLQQ